MTKCFIQVKLIKFELCKAHPKIQIVVYTEATPNGTHFQYSAYFEKRDTFHEEKRSVSVYHIGNIRRHKDLNPHPIIFIGNCIGNAIIEWISNLFIRCNITSNCAEIEKLI